MPDGNREVARQQRAYSLLTIKSVNDDERVITGVASTPEPDRYGDVVESKGAQFTLPLPLLYQHNSRQPIGQVTAAKVTDAGIEITARIAKGVPVEFIDEAWELIKAGLVAGLSIGFSPIEYSFMKEGGIHFVKWDWYELSCVTIPANASSTIQTIKSADQQARAVSGRQRSPVVHLSPPPGASGGTTSIPQGTEMKTIAEQIAGFEAKRAAVVAQQMGVQQKALDEGRTKTKEEKEAFDGFSAEIDSIDAELKDLRTLEAQTALGSKSVTKVPDSGAASNARDVSRTEKKDGNGLITFVQPNIEKGIQFVRYVKAMVQAKGILPLAAQIAAANKHWMDQTPEVAAVLRAAVAAGDTTTAGWASELVYAQNISGAFLEYLRPMTIIGKIQNMTPVPFNVRWGTQTGGASGYWVGQGSPTPVSKLTTGSDTLGIAKAAGLVVLDKELMMSSDPSAELLVRNDLGKTISQFLDVQFIAPDYAAVANVSPASITNGVDPTAASGTAAANLRTDAQNLFATFDTNNLEGPDFVWITTPKIARAISMMLTSLGEPLYPTVTPFGGTFMGYPLIVSGSSVQVGSPVTNEGNLLVLCHAPSIAMADQGGLTIDASEEAAIQMLDNPTNASTGGTTATTMVSMFQTNSVALRATRFINWKKRRTFAVQYIKDANYTS
jgi:HK97 family phage major capsid protein/HK97 family phage prohead protease